MLQNLSLQIHGVGGQPTIQFSEPHRARKPSIVEVLPKPSASSAKQIELIHSAPRWPCGKWSEIPGPVKSTVTQVSKQFHQIPGRQQYRNGEAVLVVEGRILASPFLTKQYSPVPSTTVLGDRPGV